MTITDKGLREEWTAGGVGCLQLVFSPLQMKMKLNWKVLFGGGKKNLYC